MIIFYNKNTGLIEGTIDGRVHGEQHLKMWVGDPKETDRIVIQWEPVKWFDRLGNEVAKEAPDIAAVGYSVNHEQAELILEFEKDRGKLYQYKIDPETKKFIPK